MAVALSNSIRGNPGGKKGEKRKKGDVGWVWQGSGDKFLRGGGTLKEKKKKGEKKRGAQNVAHLDDA